MKDVNVERRIHQTWLFCFDVTSLVNIATLNAVRSVSFKREDNHHHKRFYNEKLLSPTILLIIFFLWCFVCKYASNYLQVVSYIYIYIFCCQHYLEKSASCDEISVKEILWWIQNADRDD